MQIAFVEQLENARNSYLNKINASMRGREVKKMLSKSNGSIAVGAFTSEQENTIRELAPMARIIKNEPLSYSEYGKIAEFAFKATNRALKARRIISALNISGIDFSRALEHYLIDETVQALRKVFAIKKTLERHRANSIIVQSSRYRTGAAALSVAKSLGIQCRSSGGIVSEIKSRARDRLGRKFYFEAELYASNASLFSISESSGKKVLIDSRYINHLRAIKPICEGIRGHSIMLFCPEQEASRAFEALKTVDADAKVKERSHDFTGIIADCENDSTFRKIFSFSGIDIWPCLRDIYLYAFSEGLSRLVKEKEQFEKILGIARPDIMIVGDDRAIGTRCHVLAAKKLGIKIVDVQHGLDPDIAAMATPISDLILVGGLYSKKHYMRFGTSAKRIKIAGWPQYDSLFGKRADIQAKNRLLFAPDAAYAPQNVEVLKLLESSLQESDTLIVKPHPGDDEELYRKAVKMRNVQVVPKKDSIIKYINESSAVITGASTAGLEALLLGKPLVIINLEREVNTGYVYTSFGAALEITSEDEIRNMRDALNKNIGRMRKKIPSFIRLCAYRMDGKSAQRAANEIERCLS